jgi:hypothetical protein
VTDLLDGPGPLRWDALAASRARLPATLLRD